MANAGLLAQPCCGLVSDTLQTGPPRLSFGAARRWDTHKGEALLFEAQLVRVSHQEQQQQQQQAQVAGVHCVVQASDGTAKTRYHKTSLSRSALLPSQQRVMLLITDTTCMGLLFAHTQNSVLHYYSRQCRQQASTLLPPFPVRDACFFAHTTSAMRLACH
jgi:hypothetical protein